MSHPPAIPALVLIPGDPHTDYRTLYAIATAYAQSAQLISSHGKQTNHLEFTFPAVVCSGFAIELFMKFFLMLDRSDKEDALRQHDHGHRLTELWNKIDPKYQRLIAGMFGNRTGTPFLSASNRRIRLFLEALTSIGDRQDSPFVRWRYVYELPKIDVMSHDAIVKVLDALEHAAEYIIRERTDSE